MKVKTYQKVPVEVEAMQFPTAPASGRDVMEVPLWMVSEGWPWLTGNALEPEKLKGANSDGCGIWIRPIDGAFMIRTLEGDMKVSSGDWVIRGVKGEFYPCKPDVFARTYVEVAQDD